MAERGIFWEFHPNMQPRKYETRKKSANFRMNMMKKQRLMSFKKIIKANKN